MGSITVLTRDKETGVTDTFLNHEYIIETLRVADLNIDDGPDGYQRPTTPGWVDAMEQQYNPDLFDVLTVSMRSDGTYWVIDGRHRLELARRKGIREVICRVILGLDPAGEAELFTLFATKRLKIEQYDTYKAELAANHLPTVALAEFLEEAGFVPVPIVGNFPREIREDEPYPIKAIKTIKAIFRTDAGITLGRVLSTIRRAWHDSDPAVAVQSSVLKGLARFYSRFPEADDDRVVQVLEVVSPKMLKAKAAARRSGDTEVAPSTAMTLCIVDLYNKRLKSHRRLSAERAF